MANDEHVAILKNGVDAWNAWRDKNPDIPLLLRGANLIKADLGGANLSEADLSAADLLGANLREANLSDADLSAAYLRGADLSRAELGRANLSRAELGWADLRGANLSEADLSEAKLVRAFLDEANLCNAKLSGADLRKADLRKADLGGANLRRADLREANLVAANLSAANLVTADLSAADLGGANLSETDLDRANLREANLREANLSRAYLREANLRTADLQSAIVIKTDFSGADLTGCRIHGVSAWSVRLEETSQQNLVITRNDEPAITVDNIEVAQFIYLLLHIQKIRDIIDTITSKTVLILGRFTDERKAVLDALREELREHDYLPILFDFDVPATRDITETISLLARMARFVVADITDARSIPQELAVIVPDLPSVPVQPLLLEGNAEYSMFEHFRRYPWVLETYIYPSSERLIADLGERVIGPAEKYARSVKA
jgi:uncharacterized protein YjbI with pentapeptide repeats